MAKSNSNSFHARRKQGTPITLDWLFERSTPIPFSGCWSWDMALNIKGYGHVHIVRGKGFSAHRRAYELAKGPIPDGLHIDHLCRVPSCINPDHMEAVTPEENRLRGKNGALRVPPAACGKGHVYGPDNPRRAKGWACTICYKAVTKKNNDITNAKRKAAAMAADPLYGSEERRLARVADGIRARWAKVRSEKLSQP